jgi:alpha-1,3-rhamnosyl/mannosyltransferase
MKILFDMTPVYSTSGGNHTYSKELYSALSRRPDLSLQTFSYKRKPSDYQGVMRKCNAAYRDLLYFTALGRLRSSGVDLVHSTGSPVLSHVTGDKHVITVHDLAIIDTPERFSSWSKWYFEKIYLSSLKRCRAIITNSQFTQSRLQALFPDLALKSTVTPLAAKDFSQIESIPVKGLDDEFFLFVGSSDPAKNFKLLHESYQEAGAHGVVLPKTVLVGTRNFGEGDNRDSGKNLVELGGVSDGQLKWLYEKCVAFLFPSYYEGFGLPVLEAMSCGVPVICGRVCSLPEVAGDAACYSELNAVAFYEAMERLYLDSDYRKQLVERGRVHLGMYDWQHTADLTHRVYSSIMN